MSAEKFSRKRFQQYFWQGLSTSSYLKFLLATFFLFLPLAFVADILNYGQTPVPQLWFNAFFTGLMGAVYVFLAIRKSKLLIVAVVFYFLVLYLLPDGSAAPLERQPLKARLLIDGLGIALSLAIAYSLFIYFISSEGIRQVEALREMTLAREIHQQLVPAIQHRCASFEVYGRVQPATEVGGDLVEFQQQDNGIMAVVADVSGHGLGAAMLMAMYKTCLRTALAQTSRLSQLATLINQTLVPLRKRSMFLTAAFLQLQNDGQGSFLSAGHLPVLHYRPQSSKLLRLPCGQLPLAWNAHLSWQEHALKWQPGDIFLLLTDGIVESEAATGEQFGLEGVESVVRQAHTLPIQQLVQQIFEASESHGTIRDDRAVLAIRCLATDSQPSNPS